MNHHEDEFEALEQVLIDPKADPIELSYPFLDYITKGFTEVIGDGGFGIVYKGFIKSTKVAVKKLFRTADFSDVQFNDELGCLRRAKHKNIVRCLGYCSDTTYEEVEHKGKLVLAEKRRKFLCFEYMPNQSLHDYLKDDSCRSEWETRYRWILGICRGLQYLHNEERINHLDLKPANILLDASMVPKITDFGLSRRFSGAQSRKITENIRGSLGYIAPEYWNKGEISFKTDIFSLGVIIRNILTGSTDLSNFESWHKSLDQGPQLKRCIEVAQLCVDDDQHKRPTINLVIEMLNVKETEVKMVPSVLGQSRNISSTVQQASISAAKLVDKMTSMAVSAAAASRSQLQPTMIIPTGLGQASSADQVSSSISKVAADDVKSVDATAAPSSQQQHHHQVISVLKVPGEQSTKGHSFVHDLVNEVQSISAPGPSSTVQQITAVVSKGPQEISNEISKLLDVYPPHLCFRFEPNKLIRCPVTLTNKTEQFVGVWITLTEPDRRRGFGFPVICGNQSFDDPCSYFCELMDPHSSLGIPLTMKQLRVFPTWDAGKFEVLMIVMRQKEHLEKLMKVSNMDGDLLNMAEELAGMVHRVILTASIRDPTSCQEVIASNRFMPKRTAFWDVDVITDVHPTETWFLARHQKGGFVSIWNYQTQERVSVVQVTKVPSRGIAGPSRESQNHNHRNLLRHEPPPAAPSQQYHRSNHPSSVRDQADRLGKGVGFRDPASSLPADIYPQHDDVGPAVGGSERVEGRGIEEGRVEVPRQVLKSAAHGKSHGVDGAQLGRSMEEVRIAMAGGSSRRRGKEVQARYGQHQHNQATRKTWTRPSGGRGWGGGRGVRVFYPLGPLWQREAN